MNWFSSVPSLIGSKGLSAQFWESFTRRIVRQHRCEFMLPRTGYFWPDTNCKSDILSESVQISVLYGVFVYRCGLSVTHPLSVKM